MDLEKRNKFIEKCFKDKDGKFVFGQFPNIPIMIWAVSRIVEVSNIFETYNQQFSFIGNSFLVVWAWLELRYGVNYFRRSIGLIALIIFLVSIFI